LFKTKPRTAESTTPTIIRYLYFAVKALINQRFFLKFLIMVLKPDIDDRDHDKHNYSKDSK